MSLVKFIHAYLFFIVLLDCLFKLFIHLFWMHWAFFAMYGFSLVAVAGGD